ncbi:MAG: hypothetical protein IT444_04230 [Phycisphaeraceae bacterium]|nr:hypothetical protein [Phycisphaeraceae bacterium]
MNRRAAWVVLVIAMMTTTVGCISRREPDVVVTPSFSYLQPAPVPGSTIAVVTQSQR